MVKLLRVSRKSRRYFLQRRASQESDAFCESQKEKRKEKKKEKISHRKRVPGSPYTKPFSATSYTKHRRSDIRFDVCERTLEPCPLAANFLRLHVVHDIGVLPHHGYIACSGLRKTALNECPEVYRLTLSFSLSLPPPPKVTKPKSTTPTGIEIATRADDFPIAKY